MMTAKMIETPPATEHAPSDEQNRIYEWFERGTGNLVVRARAGTGKTYTLINGVKLAPERSVLLAAFNKTIANELQSRCGGDGGRGSRIEAKTLHGLGFRYIGRARPGVKVDENGERAFDLARRAAPESPIQMTRLIRDLHSKAREIDPLAVNDAEAYAIYDVAARFELLPEEEWELRGWNARRVCEAAHRAMKLALEPAATVDFADMIFLPIVKQWVRPWFDMVVIDEAQDMTLPQLTIAIGSCRRGGRVAVIGDDRQAIYGFRGADSGSLDRLKTELRATELGLTTTYRCGKTIVDLAARIVPDYRAADGAAPGEIVTMPVDDVVAKAAEGDFILSRKNGPLVRICLALIKRGVRASVRGRDIGKGILALIHKLNAATPTDLAEMTKAWLEREIAAVFKKFDEETAQERANELMDKAAVIDALCEGADIVADVERRCTELFSDDNARGAVMLSTVHKAKGLEAATVYILRDTMRELGDLPLPHATMSGARLGEEQNINYVAITRAKTRLVWAHGEPS